MIWAVGRVRLLEIRAIIVCIMLLFSGCGLCGQSVAYSSVAPNNRVVATVLVQNCGATTPYFTLVEIRRRYRWLGFEETTIFSAKYDQDIQLIWTGSNRLMINCRTCSGESDAKFKTQWKEVEIQVVLGNT